MKNKLTGVIAFLIFALCHENASSQVTVRPGLRSGLSLSGVADIEGDSRTSFYVGGFVAFRLTKWYTLQPELNYSRQGTKVRNIANIIYPMFPDVNDGTFSPTYYPATWKLNYLGLTVNNKFHLIQGFNLQIGPYLDFLVSERNVDVQNEVDTGVNFGLGYDFKNGLGVEARVRAGFVDVFDDYSNDDFDDSENNYLNSAFQIGVTYTFNLTKTNKP